MPSQEETEKLIQAALANDVDAALAALAADADPNGMTTSRQWNLVRCEKAQGSLHALRLQK